MNTTENTIGNYAPDFEIPGIDKEVYHLGSYRREFKAIAVIFMSNNIPDVDSYIERLNQIQAEFIDQGFTIIGIDSNHRQESIAESFELMKNYAQAKNITFPYLRDPTQDVAKSFKVQLMPTVFLLDSDAVIRYEGRIDDCAESADQVTNHYLRNSIAALLSGKAIAEDYIKPVGSPIEWRSQK
jgi:peroxiredoxin